MSTEPEPGRDADQPMVYQIRVGGHLSRQPLEWLEEFTVALEEGGTTLLTGPVIDQAALHGILKRIRDLGLPLLAVHSTGAQALPGTQDRQAGDS